MLFMKNRFNEVQEHLGPTLEALKMEPRMFRRAPNHIAIAFMTKTGSRVSPVEVHFEDRRKQGIPEPRWEDAHLDVRLYEQISLGDTDWECWQRVGDAKRELKGEGAERFKWLSFVLDYHGALPTPRLVRNVIVNPAVGHAYNILVNFFPDIDIYRESKLELGNPVETLTFINPIGQRVSIRMNSGFHDAGVFIEGKLVTRVDQKDRTLLIDLARDLKSPKHVQDFWPEIYRGY